MSVALNSSIRTCKVNTAWANRVESDRFLNPVNMVCPVWNGFDTSGRQVCPDSFFTKRAGCNSAEDRVVVENNVSRPQYIEYINGNVGGIAGNIYKEPSYKCDAAYMKAGRRTAELENAVSPNNPMGTGRFGYQNTLAGNIYPSCSQSPMKDAQQCCAGYKENFARNAQAHRLNGGAAVMSRQHANMVRAGNRP